VSAVYVVPGVTDGDLQWMREAMQIDSPLHEATVRADRLRRLTVGAFVERRWSPRDGWLVLLTPKGRDLVREFTDDE
jgi:hypothetical protein